MKQNKLFNTKKEVLGRVILPGTSFFMYVFKLCVFLDYAQKYTTTHIVKIASLRKKVESNKKGLANHEKKSLY